MGTRTNGVSEFSKWGGKKRKPDKGPDVSIFHPKLVKKCFGYINNLAIQGIIKLQYIQFNKKYYFKESTTRFIRMYHILPFK